MQSNKIAANSATETLITMKPGILLVGNFLAGKGGSKQPCEEIALRLAARGWNVATTSGVRNRFGRMLDMLRTAWVRRRHYQIAVIDVFSGLSFAWTLCTAILVKALGKKMALVLHGGGLPGFASRHPRLVRHLLSKADRVLAPSEYLRAGLLPYRSGIGILPNGIELSHCTMRPQTHPAPRLVWLRTFCSIYNPGMAVEVAAALRGNFPGIQLTMVGPDKDGSLKGVRELAERRGLSACVHFPGGVPKEEVPRMLASGDIFINTTTVDNAPVSVIEAMACGLPIVSTNVGGIPFLLKDGEDALLVPSGDVAAMAAAVRRLLTEPETAGRLSRNGRAKAERFDWKVVLPQWESLFAGLSPAGGDAQADR